MVVIGRVSSMQQQTRQQKHWRPPWLRTHSSIRRHLRSRIPAPVQWKRLREQHSLRGSRPPWQHSWLQNGMAVVFLQQASRHCLLFSVVSHTVDATGNATVCWRGLTHANRTMCAELLHQCRDGSLWYTCVQRCQPTSVVGMHRQLAIPALNWRQAGPASTATAASRLCTRASCRRICYTAASRHF